MAEEVDIHAAKRAATIIVNAMYGGGLSDQDRAFVRSMNDATSDVALKDCLVGLMSKNSKNQVQLEQLEALHTLVRDHHLFTEATMQHFFNKARAAKQTGVTFHMDAEHYMNDRATETRRAPSGAHSAAEESRTMSESRPEGWRAGNTPMHKQPHPTKPSKPGFFRGLFGHRPR